eukprot:CAMPEP_0173455928 /NCGR_PEP_ID=MMETSP1357-20121228/55196_1 /TAXON_ID=77926 /ORGANISM="Hemiselmis rufescens, Strain PCC563" /LENGTH=69 /DNA_ID=CAMNT_0014423095 /DNA_START=83 /DNA_END=289 /DNA_ORIENTATION=-
MLASALLVGLGVLDLEEANLSPQEEGCAAAQPLQTTPPIRPHPAVYQPQELLQAQFHCLLRLDSLQESK